jgi:hypothetical protein
VTTTPQGHAAPQGHAGATSALDELRAAYHEQLTRLAAERDAARRQARRAQGQADVARADLASLKSRVAELLIAAARHLPELPAAQDEPAQDEGAQVEGAPDGRALPAAARTPDPDTTPEDNGDAGDGSARAA